jgi:predicted component of type VI protein secretion system
LIDQMEHAQPTQSVVDLPKPRWEAPVQRQFLPEDWNSDPVDEEPSLMEPPREAAPVKNRETEYSRIFLQALAEGLGADAALFAHADASTVLRNAGAMLATALSCLQSLVSDRNKASQRLGAVSADASGPSFVLSLGGRTAEALIVNAANFLAEAKRDEIGLLANDFEALRRHEAALLEGALEAMCAIARESDSAMLTSRLPVAAKLAPLPLVKKAALWDMVEASETLKPLAGNAVSAGVEKLLGRAYAKRLTS